VRVLHFIPSMGGGGAERQLAYLAKSLVQSGCETHVALIRGGPNLRRLEMAGATIHQLGPLSDRDPRVLIRLTNVVRRVKPDLVQSWLAPIAAIGGMAAIAAGRPWVFCERTSAEAHPESWKTRVSNFITLSASAIVSNSAAGDRYWQSKAGDRVARYIIPNGVPVDEIDAASMATPEDIGVAPGEVVVLYAGRYSPEKNVAVLVSALSRMKNTPFRAICCGEGPLRAEIASLVQAHNLGERVRVLGYTSNLWNWMKRATVFVAPSRFEGRPNVVLEAMACRCPLVVSDIPQHRELLDEHSAVLVPVGDSVALAQSIGAVLEDPVAAAARAAVARSRVEPFDLPAVARQYLSVYGAVLSRTSLAPERVG